MKKRHVISIILLAVVSITISNCSFTFRDGETDNTSNKQIAESVINSIDQFQHEHGYLPESLSLLVPDYLASVPLTVRGDNFVYHSFHDSDRGEDYELCFFDDTSNKTSYGCCYMNFFDNPPNYDGWDCTRGAE
ncbi:MAG: hypothetical protein ACOYZ6_01240 [Chloroflexota bacterium]